MAVNLETLQADPAFQALPAVDQAELLAEAKRRNAQDASQSPAAQAAPPATPEPGLLERLRTGARDVATTVLHNPVVQGSLDAANFLGSGGAVQPWLPEKVKGAVREGVMSPSNIGEQIGTTAPVGPWRPVTGAVGAAAGEGVRQWWEGEPFNWRKIAAEGALSLVPEVAEPIVRRAGRRFLQQSPGGIIRRGEHAAEQARQLPERVFQPRPADEISEAFREVERTNLRIDTDDIYRHLNTLSPGKQADVENLLVRLDSTHSTGGRYRQLYQDLLRGQGMAGANIGDLQRMRSHLRQRAQTLAHNSEARQLVQDLQDSVDDAIDFGMTSGAMQASTPQIRDTLHQARRDWARRMAADDLGDMVENKISSSGNLESQTIQIRALYDELRRGRSALSKSVNRALDATPGARERFEIDMREIAKNYDTIQMPMTDVAGIYRWPVVAAARQWTGEFLLSETGRSMFRDAILTGRGTISPNQAASIANAMRREGVPGATGNVARRVFGDRQEGVQSWFAPGGRSRTTD